MVSAFYVGGSVTSAMIIQITYWPFFPRMNTQRLDSLLS
jgi:hypothetical protein